MAQINGSLQGSLPGPSHPMGALQPPEVAQSQGRGRRGAVADSGFTAFLMASGLRVVQDPD